MAKISKPQNRKGLPPSIEDTIGNLDKKEDNSLKAMNFKVPLGFHRRFKMFATENNLSMVELLTRSFESFVNESK